MKFIERCERIKIVSLFEFNSLCDDTVFLDQFKLLLFCTIAETFLLFSYTRSKSTNPHKSKMDNKEIL